MFILKKLRHIQKKNTRKNKNFTPNNKTFKSIFFHQIRKILHETDGIFRLL